MSRWWLWALGVGAGLMLLLRRAKAEPIPPPILPPNPQFKVDFRLERIIITHDGFEQGGFRFEVTPDRDIDVIIYTSDRGGLSTKNQAFNLKITLHIATSATRANKSEDFYNTKVAPYIDGKNIVSRGFFEGNKKSDFIRKGKAFLFPLRWDEPFGLTMIEAMACGTPVIAYNHGSVSEIVRDGLTGFIVDPDDEDRPGKGTWVIKKQGIEGLIEAVRRIGEIDRKACRKHIEDNFTVEKMVDGYEKVYHKILNRH